MIANPTARLDRVGSFLLKIIQFSIFFFNKILNLVLVYCFTSTASFWNTFG
jgi:hypothetical protein